MPVRSKARTALAVVAWLFAVCIVVQVFLAGLGVFDSPTAFATHRDFGYTFGLLTLVMVVIAAVGRLPKRLIGLSALTLLQIALQSVFIAFRQDMPVIAALHPVNGVLLLVVAIWLGREAWTGRDQPAISEAPLAASEATS
jgi:mercuric ion transport protein